MSINYFGGIKLTDEALLAKLKRPHFLYKNIVTYDNVTASSSAADFPALSLANPLTAERWKPTVMDATVTVDAGALVNVDAVGIASHSLHLNASTVTIEASIHGTSWDTIKSFAPSNGRPLLAIFDKVTYRYFRLTVSGATAPSIGALFIGEALVMPQGIYGGHTPITMGRQAKRITNKTEGGQFAGNSVVHLGVKTSFSLKHLKAAWYREFFEPFAKYLTSGAPFFAAWRPSDYPDEVGYCWPEGDVTPQNTGVKDFMEVDLSVSGYSDE